MPSNFDFLAEFRPDWAEEASKAELYGRSDPRASCFYSRRVLELLVNWMYDAEPALQVPYNRLLGARIGDAVFKQVMPEDIWLKMDLIVRRGNAAVHDSAPVKEQGSMWSLEELWHVMFWAARIYSPKGTQLASNPPTFDASIVLRSLPPGERKQRQADIKAMLDANERKDDELVAQREHNAELKKAHDAEVAELQRQIAAAKAANQAVPDTHDYNEAETRTHVIDLLLADAGWDCDDNMGTEVATEGLEFTESGKGKIDYVLYGDNGKPVGLVEAKRTRKDPRTGQNQAKDYADALEKQYGQRPIIFCTNGYHFWIWDDDYYPPRSVAGFYTPDELGSMIQRRVGRKRLRHVPTSPTIVDRPYQKRVIAAVDEAFDEEKRRHALLVMATGTGKTRVAIALVDQLMRAGWVKRVLFLADRQALVTQAKNQFATYLPDVPSVSLLEHRKAEARVYVSTYQTMMGLIDERGDDGKRRFGPGCFDLVIVDEAHRTIYQKYGAMLDYFDSLLLGLTATPKDEIDRNTYQRFQLRNRLPTDVYDLEAAVADNWLVPPKAIKVPLQLPVRGIRYADLTDDEKEHWDEVDWNSEGIVPNRVTPDDVNKYLYNSSTVDEMLRVLMEKGIKVDGGDRLGKTIVFARNQRHAQFIAERFDINYPRYRGQFAQVITHAVTHADQLIGHFEVADKTPHIAISVDMLDTGIDVPDVVNLVLFKPVHSRTKFWQMIGRGTRLRPNLFGPNRDKTGFLVFDAYDNLEFFQHQMHAAEGRLNPSVNEQIFKHRAELIYRLDQEHRPDD